MRAFSYTALAAMVLAATPVQAAYVLNVQQIGTSVYAFGAGALDMTGTINTFSRYGGPATTNPSGGILTIGANDPNDSARLYVGYSGPSSFGPGGSTDATTFTGQPVGMLFGSLLALPANYVSGSDLGVSSATWANQSLASLGLNAGTYNYVVGLGDTLTVKVEATFADANYGMIVQQIGTSVYAFGAGALDMTGTINTFSRYGGPATTNPSGGILTIGANDPNDSARLYVGYSGPSSFGPGGSTDATTFTGQPVGMLFGSLLALPANYVSGSDLGVSSATWANQSLASLGLNAGTYNYNVGTNGRLRVRIGEPAVITPGGGGGGSAPVPEPSSWALMLIGFGMLGYKQRRRIPAIA